MRATGGRGNGSDTFACMTNGDELLARIAADPDDDSTYLVYADWLEAAGDPVGELVVLMHQLAAAERDNDEARRAQLGSFLDVYTTKHRTKLFGKLGNHAGIAWDFHLGLLRTVRVVPDIQDDRGALIAQILALPIARVLRELVVFEDITREHGAIVDAVKRDGPKTLPGVTFAQKYDSLTGVDPAAVRWFEIQFGPQIPDAIFELPNLECLELSRTNVAVIPPRIAELRKLRRLDISWCNALESLPEELFGIETLSYVQMYECFGLRRAYHMGRVNNLLGGFTRARTPSRRRIIEANLFLDNQRRALELATTEDLLAALDNNVATVQESALHCLATRLPDPFANPLEPGAIFAQVGKQVLLKDWLAKNLAPHGGTLATKISPTTTHVIVGAKPGGKQLDIGARSIVLGTHLGAWFHDTKTTKQAAFDTDGVREGLRSRDDAVTLRAIDTLPERIPPELLTDLVVVSMDVKLKKSRAAAKRQLAAMAPASLTNAIKVHLQQSLLLESMGETKRSDRITAFCRAAKVIDPLELAIALGARARVALAYVFAHGKPADITRALEMRVDRDGVLDLSIAELAEIPAELAALPVVALDLSSNHLKAWPDVLGKMPSLARLDLSSNRITKLPAAAGKLRLTELALADNGMRTFPMPVLEITTLRRLDLSNSQHYVDDEARITGLPDGIGALKQLASFAYRFQILEQLPASLFTLRALTELDLMMCTLPAEIPAELAKLTSLRTLELGYSTWATRAPELRRLLPNCTISATR